MSCSLFALRENDTFYCELTSPGAPCLKDFLQGFAKLGNTGSNYLFLPYSILSS